MKRKIPAFLLPIILLLLVFPLAPAAADPVPPQVAATSAVMINADTGQLLYSVNPDAHLAMASTTKMMTALIIIEKCKDLKAPVTTSERAATIGESSIFLKAGDTLSVQEMLNGLLIQSGNDAAIALAEYEAGSEEAFVDQMNKRAAQLGMTNTHFVNAHGLDADGHYTSAADFARLGRELMKHPEIREIVKRTSYDINWPGDPVPRSMITHLHVMETHPEINGIKTGFTDNAGQCVVVSASRNGVNLIISYLGGPSLDQRDADILSLEQYGFDSYQQKTVIARGNEYASVDVPFNYEKKLPLTAEEDVSRLVYMKSDVEQHLVLPDELQLPIHKGDRIGLVEITENGKYVGSTYLLASEDIKEPGVTERMSYYMHSAFGFLLSAARVN
ncbi:MAG: D-alanyl-D-alanine carboxypeptidase family protein [Thermoleophilia bacterium]